MRLVTIKLVPHGCCPVNESPPAVITDVIWTAATPEDLLEHVSIRSGPAVIHLGFYSRLDGKPASASAAAICRRALATSPSLSGWKLAAVQTRRQ